MDLPNDPAIAQFEHISQKKMIYFQIKIAHKHLEWLKCDNPNCKS